MNGKTIGVYANAGEIFRRLREFLSINSLDCAIREYTADELSEDGTLYAYLESGEVDLLLGNFAEKNASFRMITSFDSQPYYIVTTLENREVLDGLNMALERITDANLNFGTERYNANFSKRTVDIQLSDEEMEYVRGRGGGDGSCAEELASIVSSE